MHLDILSGTGGLPTTVTKVELLIEDEERRRSADSHAPGNGDSSPRASLRLLFGLRAGSRAERRARRHAMFIAASIVVAVLIATAVVVLLAR